MALTIISTTIMCFSGISFILTMVYFFAHYTYLFGFENSRETTAIIKEFYRNYETSYEKGGEPIFEYYNEFTHKTVRKQLMNTNISPSNASVGDLVRIQYTGKKERIIEPKYITEKTYKIEKYIIPPITCAVVCLVSFGLLVASILL